MTRKLSALLVGALLALPAVARAHDPLDDVSGEDEFKPKNDDKPRSHKKERQEAELAKEAQERDEAEFHVNTERDEFVHDRAESRDVKEAQRRRDILSGTKVRRNSEDGAPPPSRRGSSESAPASRHSESSSDDAPRGDVDPTAPGADDARSGSHSSGDAAFDAPAKSSKKKKHR